MNSENLLLLGRLRGAVKKIRFLLNFNVNRWKLASIIGASSSNRRLSFNDRPGLRACMDDSDSNDSGSARGRLQRTISYPSDEDDIDKRADMFIANFHRQLRIERQISLELRYTRGNSIDSASPWIYMIKQVYGQVYVSNLKRRNIFFSLVPSIWWKRAMEWNLYWSSKQSSKFWLLDLVRLKVEKVEVLLMESLEFLERISILNKAMGVEWSA